MTAKVRRQVKCLVIMTAKVRRQVNSGYGIENATKQLKQKVILKLYSIQAMFQNEMTLWYFSTEYYMWM